MYYISVFILNFLVFLFGTIFGSIINIVTYRICAKKKILKGAVTCDHCNTKLSFFETIPFFSYIFLKGKCRHCKKDISTRYFLVEACFGIIFLIIFNSFNIVEYYNIPTNVLTARLLQMFFIPFVLAFMYIISAIDIQKKYIDKNTMLYGIITVSAYIIFETILHNNIHRLENIHILIYLAYVCIIIILTIMQTANIRRSKKAVYILDVVIYILTISMFMGSYVMIISLFLTSLIYVLLELCLNGKKMLSKTSVPVTPIITTTTILTYIIYNYFSTYMVRF